MSWEQLELMAEAHSRVRAGEILALGQMIAGDAKAFKAVQEQLINKING